MQRRDNFCATGERCRSRPKRFSCSCCSLSTESAPCRSKSCTRRLWPSTFVLDTNIASLIAEIRRALDDDAAKPQFIRTMHRFGYRFVGQVDEPPAMAVRTQSAASTGWCGNSGRFRSPKVANVIGRGADASVWIDAPGVSRHHARIVIDGGDATLEDLGSKNGTYVAGERVTTPRRLDDGDQIRLGSVVVTFRIPRLSVATETVS